jgi:Domain of unknown function (DUF1707)/Cell wall-active antibiotics response 4TMS YvqF
MDDDAPQPPAIRASDEERERSVARLQDAVISGRLTLEEFSDRVGRAQAARTDRELAALTLDLPSHEPPAPSGAPVSYRATFSRLDRRGAWEVPARSSWRSLFGTIILDLRAARLAGPESVLEIFNLFGTVTLLVPPGVAVDVHGGGIFASQVIDPPPWLPATGAPRLVVHLRGPGGTLMVKTSELRRAPTGELATGAEPNVG